MRTIVDLHMHSHYSRATSRHLTVDGIVNAAAQKGVDIIATGDITHPQWMEEIERRTIEDDSGFLHLRDNDTTILLTLFGEIASIYKKNGIGRRVHTLFGVSSIAAAKKVNATLTHKGFNIGYDGRPIIGMDVRELAKIYLDADPHALIIPAHIWTPWFSVFGSKSGFNALEECFEEMTPHIYAIETGLSSDPPMNWRVQNLNHITILSNSDAHSPQNVGREANIFNLPQRTYINLYDAIRLRKNLDATIEFFPEEGKYHYDGHRGCNVRLDPKETMKHKNICPKCGLMLVIGVMHRVEELTDQQEEGRPHRVPFRSIVPLPDLIAESFDVGKASKKVQDAYKKLITKLGNEFHILLDIPLDEIRQSAHPMVAEAIARMRAGRVQIDPGYDGVFGTIRIFSDEERAAMQPHQQSLL